MELQSGQLVLEGKYRLLRIIDQGGMGRVWLAKDTGTGLQFAAIKEPRADLLPEHARAVRSRYRQELAVSTALAQAGVPRIVKALSVGSEGDTLLLVMEYMSGGNLAGLLAKHPGGLPVERAVSIVLDILEGLEGVCSHPLEVVHRDLKPSNILLDEHDKAHLADFGLAQFVGSEEDLTALGAKAVIGTTAYAAPEQEQGKGYLTPAADLYALGCILFELLTGRRYKGQLPGTSARSLRNEVPPWLDVVLSNALIEDPAHRFQRASEMAIALREREEGLNRLAKEREHRLATLREESERALAAGQWHRLRSAATIWLQQEPKDERPKTLLAQAETILSTPSLQRTPTGVVIATPDNLQMLLSMPIPPPQIWWDRAQMLLCLVPAGEFLMGCRKTDPNAFPRERPQRSVHLDAYYVGCSPVTQAQYCRFLQESDRKVPFAEYPWAQPYNWDQCRRVPPPEREAHPVVMVSWHDAAAFCKWAGMRLLTEAEWEKAARGVDGRVYPWGKAWNASRCNTVERGDGATTPVGYFSPGGDSPFGCADMAGNIWEWCSDWFAKDAYRHAPSQNPTGPASGTCKVLRGGSWNSPRDRARVTFRHGHKPGDCYLTVGFRCCLAPELLP